MTGEEIPLLGIQHDHIYDRFSPRQKRFLVAIVSWGGLVACMFGYWRIRISTECFAVFCSGTFVPSIPQIAQDFNSTGEVIRYVISFISDTNIERFGLVMRSAYISSQPHVVALLAQFTPNSVSMNISYLTSELILYRWPTPLLLMVSPCDDFRFSRRCTSSNCLAIDDLAVHTGDGSIPWTFSGSRGDW